MGVRIHQYRPNALRSDFMNELPRDIKAR